MTRGVAGFLWLGYRFQGVWTLWGTEVPQRRPGESPGGDLGRSFHKQNLNFRFMKRKKAVFSHYMCNANPCTHLSCLCDAILNKIVHFGVMCLTFCWLIRRVHAECAQWHKDHFHRALTKPPTHPPPSAFVTGFALISRVASGAAGGPDPWTPRASYAPAGDTVYRYARAGKSMLAHAARTACWLTAIVDRHQDGHRTDMVMPPLQRCCA